MLKANCFEKINFHFHFGAKHFRAPSNSLKGWVVYRSVNNYFELWGSSLRVCSVQPLNFLNLRFFVIIGRLKKYNRLTNT